MEFLNDNVSDISPIEILKLVTISSIFGDEFFDKIIPKKSKFIKYNIHIKTKNELLILKEMRNKKIFHIIEKTIDNALDFNFGATLNWCEELQKKYEINIIQHIILVRAAMHFKRANFNLHNPKLFKNIAKRITKNGDDPALQLMYYVYANNGKKKIPNMLKVIWKQKIESMTDYEIIINEFNYSGLVNVVRLCHANSENINLLMNNKLFLKETNKDLKPFINKINFNKIWEKLSHLDLLESFKIIFIEITKKNTVNLILQTVEDGVIKEKLSPFAYFRMLKIIENKDLSNKTLIMESLERCIDLAMSNLPILNGKTVCLADNSASCWGKPVQKLLNTKNAELNNLLSVITATNSESGEVVKFGDNNESFKVNIRDGILNQMSKISSFISNKAETEHGAVIFFQKAVKENMFYDNIFIYTNQNKCHDKVLVLLLELISEYRKQVNVKVNVFIVNTTKHKKIIMPEYLYRTFLIYGWSGKEILFAKAINEILAW